ncbi:unnamed protein product [Nesidiocoris tenuis]|uniref:L-type lectin-like domain-containing protein n=1 Tax=Nesidiocoris tenuis TaxID=355587 RepID=A0A6H5G2G7_9HEMI|nr:unnamed protein product [Nesidiocoris tenuis]
MHVNFKIHGHGKDLFGDGMAIWYTKDRMIQGPVFGNMDYFHGLAIFIDTYSNHNGEHNFSPTWITKANSRNVSKPPESCCRPVTILAFRLPPANYPTTTTYFRCGCTNLIRPTSLRRIGLKLFHPPRSSSHLEVKYPKVVHNSN